MMSNEPVNMDGVFRRVRDLPVAHMKDESEDPSPGELLQVYQRPEFAPEERLRRKFE